MKKKQGERASHVSQVSSRNLEFVQIDSFTVTCFSFERKMFDSPLRISFVQRTKLAITLISSNVYFLLQWGTYMSCLECLLNGLLL